MNKKSAKSARVPRGCDVARKATWQSHADPRSAYVAHYIYYIYLFSIYIKRSSAFPIWERLLML